jgi:large subunit ribosomal protein L20
MRVTYSVAHHKKVKKLFRKVKGYRGARSKLLRTAKESLTRAEAYATRDRKQKKRDFRRLWIIRINAAARAEGMRYSELIDGLKKANISINRKMLSELAINNKAAFTEIVNKAKAQLSK